MALAAGPLPKTRTSHSSSCAFMSLPLMEEFRIGDAPTIRLFWVRVEDVVVKAVQWDDSVDDRINNNNGEDD